MKWVEVKYIDWKAVFNGATYSEKYASNQFNMSIDPEDYIWEVIIRIS